MPPTAPEAALRAVELFCESRVPDEIRDQVRLECSRRGNAITIVERRPPWKEEYGPEWSSLKVARLRFDPDAEAWTLRWRDSGDRWHDYEGLRPAATVDPLLREINADPTGIFWG